MKQLMQISSHFDTFIPIFRHLEIDNKYYEMVNKHNFQEKRT